MYKIFFFIVIEFFKITISQEEILTCYPSYMELCIPDTISNYIWLGSINYDDIDIKNSCISYIKKIGIINYSCGITIYSNNTSLLIDDIYRYDCGNTIINDNDYIYVNNIFTYPKGSINIDNFIGYNGECIYNKNWISEKYTSFIWKVPETKTYILTQEGSFKTDIQICTSIECRSFYISNILINNPNEYILKISIIGSNMYPNIETCYVSPSIPKEDDTGHPDQVLIIDDYCFTDESKLNGTIYNEKKEHVIIKMPSFSFSGSKDVETGEELPFVNILCRVKVSNKEHSCTGVQNRRLLESTSQTSSVGSSILAEDTNIIYESKQDESSAFVLKIMWIFVLFFLF
eukprot:GHVL01039743.1.p1 GENE.GHVL01039743.1~~GHVL01039743.1.p1  ORF type:complete len:355 (+),score=92.03 GHVL01039743.1:28-1065(+)